MLRSLGSLLGVLAAACSGGAGVSGPAQGSATEQVMRYASEDAELQLPLGWRIARDEGDTISFVSPDERSTVTASVQRFAPGLSKSEQTELLRKLRDARFQAEREHVA